MPTAESTTIYLDNAATTWPKPATVSTTIADFLANSAGNPGRGAHKLARNSRAVMDQLRAELATLFDAPDPSRIVFTRGCTGALSNSIQGVVESERARRAPNAPPPRVIIAPLEHNAVAVPATRLAELGRIDLQILDCDAEGYVYPEQVTDLVDDNTILVECMHASNVLGTVQPVAEIAALARKANPNVLVLIDTAQTLGVLPCSLNDIDADLLAFGGHKGLLGPTGIGGLYISPRVFDPETNTDRMHSWAFGGTGSDSSDLAPAPMLPYTFEVGTPNTVGCAGLLASIQVLPEDALGHERALVAQLIEHYADNPKVNILGPTNVLRRVGLLTLDLPGSDAHAIAHRLDDEFNICVRAGLQCSPSTYRKIGIPDRPGLRISPGPFTTTQDIAHCIQSLDICLAD
jgi:selenocysteine lyase/cysteine desulfurase